MRIIIFFLCLFSSILGFSQKNTRSKFKEKLFRALDLNEKSEDQTKKDQDSIQIHNQKIEKDLKSRMDTYPINIKGSDCNTYLDPSGRCYHRVIGKYDQTINVDSIRVSKEFLSIDSNTEQLILSGSFPFYYVDKDEYSNILIYPRTVSSITGNCNAQFKEVSWRSWKTYKINGVYDCKTDNGDALIFEFYLGKDSYGRSVFEHGLIFKSRWEEILAKINNGDFGLFTDNRDGELYSWTKIGEQIWMAQNLRYKLENPKGMGEGYGDNLSGRHYNFDQALISCPDGWHLPTDEEWKQLELEVGVSQKDINLQGMISRNGIDTLTYPGKKLQNSDDLMFYSKNAGVVQDYGNSRFSASNRNEAWYWSSTKTDEVNAIFRELTSYTVGVARSNGGAQNYYNCRCVKDAEMDFLFERYPIIKSISDKIKMEPQIAQNYFDRAVELLLIGEANKSLDDIEKSIELDPGNQDQRLFKAQILYLYSLAFHQDDLINILEAYISNIKNNPFAYFLLSKITLYDVQPGSYTVSRDEAKRKKSLNLITKAINLDPKNPQLLEFKAKLMVVMDDYHNAVLALKKAISSDPNNGDLHFLLGKMKLKNFSNKNPANVQRWCTAMTGICFYVTPSQIEEVCQDFNKAIQLGAEINPDYITICSELKQAQTLKKHAPIIHIGPRGGHYTKSANGNKVYLPRPGK